MASKAAALIEMRIMDVPIASPLSADQRQKRRGRIRAVQLEILGAHKRHSGRRQFAMFRGLLVRPPRKLRRPVRRRKRLGRAPRHSVRFRRQLCAPRRPGPGKGHIRPGRARRAYRVKRRYGQVKRAVRENFDRKACAFEGVRRATGCRAIRRRTGADRRRFRPRPCAALPPHSRRQG